MKNFTFENQGTNTYLVYQIEDNDAVDTMSLGMLVNNKIPGLASAMFTQMDATKYIKYNVSSRVTVKQFFSGAVNKKRLLGVFGGIVNALLSAEDYMIDAGSVILDLDYIFADVSTCDTVLICLPVEQHIKQQDLSAFFKGIMFRTQFDQTENCDHVAHIINYLNSTPAFSLVDFKSLIEKEETGMSVKTDAAPVVQNSVMELDVQSAFHNQPVINNTPMFQQKAAEIKPVQTPPVRQRRAVRVPQQVQPQQIPSQLPPQMSPVAANMPKAGMPQQNDDASEKKIGMFGLLTHYSKENAELYKQQKAAKKAAKGQSPAQQQVQSPVQILAQPSVQASVQVPVQPSVQMPARADAQMMSQPAAQPVPAKAKDKKKQKQKQKQKQAPANSGFAVPNPNGNQDFSIPGQPVSMQPAQQVQAQQVQAQQMQAQQIRTQQMQAQQTQQMQTQQMQARQMQAQQVRTQQIQAQQVQQAFQQQGAAVMPQQQPPYVPREVHPGQTANFGETTLLGLGAVGETTVLTAAQNPNKMAAPHLIRRKNNEKISLNKPVFRVGKERSYVDYFIGDNTAISRSHANFITRDGEYFVVDTNSTNHTFVNGTMIQSNVETLISHGDVVRLANEDFEFKLY